MMNKQKLAALLAAKAKEGKIPSKQNGMSGINALGQKPMQSPTQFPSFNQAAATSNPSLPPMDEFGKINKFPKVKKFFK